MSSSPERQQPISQPYDFDTVGRYLVEIGQYPQLATEDHIRLGRLVQDGQLAVVQQTELQIALTGLGSVITEEFEPRLAAANDAKTEFIQANLRLVVSIAKKYKVTKDISLLDHIQEGNIGLIRAVEEFDPEKGFAFSTYAKFWIMQSIRHAIHYKRGGIRLPVHINESLSNIRTATDILEVVLMREPTDEEIIAETGLKPEDYKTALRVAQQVDLVSINESSHTESKTERGDFIDHPNQSVSDYALRNERQRTVDQIINLAVEHYDLTAMELEVLEQRVNEERTAMEIAADLASHYPELADYSFRDVTTIYKAAKRKLIKARDMLREQAVISEPVVADSPHEQIA